MCHAFVISQTNGENWDGIDFKMGVGRRCSEYSDWTLPLTFHKRDLDQLSALHLPMLLHEVVNEEEHHEPKVNQTKIEMH